MKWGHIATLDLPKEPPVFEKVQGRLWELGESDHIAQNAYNRTREILRADWPALGMSKRNMRCRTYAGRGGATMAKDAKLNARKRMAKEILRIRRQFGAWHDKGALTYAKVKR